MVVPVVIGALGAVSDMGKLNVTIRLEVIQKVGLLGTAEPITESFVYLDTQT